MKIIKTVHNTIDYAPGLLDRFGNFLHYTTWISREKEGIGYYL